MSPAAGPKAYDPRRDTTKAMKGRYVTWDDENPTGHPAWPTGNAFVDWATGIGGLPKGKVVEAYGPESSGKSSLAMQVAAYLWHAFRIPSVYADFEDTFDAVYAKALGLTSEGLLLEVPETLEQFLEGWDVLLTKGAPLGLVIVDSVAACRTEQDLKNAGGDDRTAGMNRARIWTQALATNVHRLADAEHTLYLVNQQRAYIDTQQGFVPPGMAAMQPKISTPGGRGIKFYASLRIAFEASSEISKKAMDPITLTETKQVIGKNVWMKIVKNKVAPPPWRKMRLQIRDGIGFDMTQNLLDFGQVHGFVTRRDGAKWTLLGQAVQGDAAAFQLARDPGMQLALTEAAMTALDAAEGMEVSPEEMAAGLATEEDSDALLEPPDPEVFAAAVAGLGTGGALPEL